MFHEFAQALKEMWGALGLPGALILTALLCFMMILYYYDRAQQRRSKLDSRSGESDAQREATAQTVLLQITKDLLVQRDALNDQRFAAQTKYISALEVRIGQEAERVTILSAEIENCERERSNMATIVQALQKEINELRQRLKVHEANSG